MINKPFYIGLMSGTSMDAIDACVVDFCEPRPQLIAHQHYAIPASLKTQLQQLCHPGENEINHLGALDHQLGILFAEASVSLLQQAGIKREKVAAIGSHGQTIRHMPESEYPFTLQIGDPNIIAERSGIVTVSDFRRRDMACGGQGAPLTPSFHDYLFRHTQHDRVILNIGGIANVTGLSASEPKRINGFDTGPGNRLLDDWIQLHCSAAYDENGQWAASGQVDQDLLQLMLQDPYFKRTPPKSTGSEYFNLSWLESILERYGKSVAVQNVQASLVELTACSVQNAIYQWLGGKGEIIVCGGGVHNQYLMSRIASLCSDFKVCSSEQLDVDPDALEAMAFAWFAARSLQGLASNCPQVTGAKREVVLGAVYPA